MLVGHLSSREKSCREELPLLLADITCCCNCWQWLQQLCCRHHLAAVELQLFSWQRFLQPVLSNVHAVSDGSLQGYTCAGDVRTDECCQVSSSDCRQANSSSRIYLKIWLYTASVQLACCGSSCVMYRLQTMPTSQLPLFCKHQFAPAGHNI